MDRSNVVTGGTAMTAIRRMARSLGYLAFEPLPYARYDEQIEDEPATAAAQFWRKSMSLHVITGAGGTGSPTALLLADAGENVRLISRRGGGPQHPLIER